MKQSVASRSSTNKLTPTERKTAHEKKDQARRARARDKARSPGPGEYNTNKSSLVGAGGSAAFNSRTQRVDVAPAAASGDPGAYDPHSSNSMASAASRSFSKSAMAGQGGFGVREKRALSYALYGPSGGTSSQKIDPTPGPGAYDVHAPRKAIDGNSSVFKSKSVRMAKSRNADTPAPSAYDPKYTAIQPELTNSAGHSMSSTNERFKATVQVTDPEVGPGTYDSEQYGSTGKPVAMAAVAQTNAMRGSNAGSAAFSSEISRTLPFEVGHVDSQAL